MTLLIAKSEWASLPRRFTLHASRPLFADSLQKHEYSAMLDFLSQKPAAVLHFRSPRSRHMTLQNSLWYLLALPPFLKQERSTRGRTVERNRKCVHVLPASSNITELYSSPSYCSTQAHHGRLGHEFDPFRHCREDLPERGPPFRADILLGQDCAPPSTL